MVVLIHVAFMLVSLLIYAISTHVSQQRRHPAAALAWGLTIMLLPYLGLPLYLLLGTRKFVRPARRKPQAEAVRAFDSTESPPAWATATLAGMGLTPPTFQNRIVLHEDGSAAWRELVTLINSAREQLDICTFVLGNDAVGRDVSRLLQARAAAGVRVRLLLDAVGSWRTAPQLLRQLSAAGVRVHWFMPLLRNPLRGRVNLRNHRKLAIADGRCLWSGGRNLAAEYFEGSGRRSPPWTDLSFTIEGPLASQTQALFNDHWRYSRGPAGAAAQSAPSLPPSLQAQARQPSGADPPPRHRAQLVPSGPDQAEDTLHSLLLTALFRARHRVRAVTPYFVPDDSLLTALRLAARRGVQVELVLPKRSNHRLADLARPRALRDLAAAGGQVRLAPRMVHAKAVVVDDTLALCGSLNLDSRSLFLNFEMMVAFYADEDIAAISHWMDRHLADARAWTPYRPSLGRDIAEGLVRWLGFQI